VVPVLTAHPTEVQRKSILNCQMVIARLLDERDRMQLTPEEQEANDEALRRAVLTLWQTRMLRTEKLSVMDEVTNGLSYFDYTSCASCRASTPTSKTASPAATAAGARWSCPTSCRWAAGSAATDGNPFVTAEILEKALATQAEKVLTYYMDEVHTLGSQLPWPRAW
jgi:phosphoenolpyruvate carboxylase